MATQRQNNKLSDIDVQEFRGQLLEWYDRHKRDLPWRAKSGQTPNPYHVWLSEIMLQQTTVGAVGSYYTKFLKLWPDIHTLAAADNETLMSAWAGLGYYARARNLHKCAKIVSNDLNGKFPDDQGELKKLPGIGDYTSAAITAIAFNKPATVVDGNVERVMSRIYTVRDPLPKSKPKLKTLAAGFFENFADRPGDLAQAFMDLGATICIPKTPRCGLCPVNDLCAAKEQGIAAELPRKKKKKPQPQKHGHVYWVTNNKSQILLHKRPEKGMLGGMIGLPTSEWLDKKQTVEHLNSIEPTPLNVSIHHTFTHYDLELKLSLAEAPEKIADDYIWRNIKDIKVNNFPTLFRKALKIFLQETQ